MFSVFEWFVLIVQYQAFVAIVLSNKQGRTKGKGGLPAN